MIEFDRERQIFTLTTQNTQYIFQLMYGDFPVHLHYGSILTDEIADYKGKVYSFAPYYPRHRLSYLPDAAPAEYSGFDSGDFRTCSLKIRNTFGDSSVNLTYTAHRIFKGRVSLDGLPFAESDGDTETLEFVMTDMRTQIEVRLYYTVFPVEDVISRYVRITNGGEGPAVIEKCMSLLLDILGRDLDMITLCGGYAHEREYQRVPLHAGNQSVFSRRGFSSHHFNPFMALCSKDADERSGEAYGFNFVYSGNFLDEAEVDCTGTTRVQIGLGGDNFSWRLESGESFIAPEAVMTYSSRGIGQMTRNFHSFIRKHILPPEPFDRRPVVLNTWEACYFNIDEAEMMRFARAAADSGIDMLVMDDGWFGARNHDRAGLGDWFENREKFKDGLASFVQKVKAHGIKFGIWIEPEMVNPDSELYRAHPDWCIACKQLPQLESRQQLVLDLGNREVLEYLKKTFSKVFDGIPIDYFKWDANRHLSGVGSNCLPPERQGEAAYRYMLGVYELYRFFREHFPSAMIENCSGGGGRYDLGMMKYSTMIWTSDNTNPVSRINIQYSSMLGYPAATMSCHVSKHKLCEDDDEMRYRYHVALGGALGYELHLPNASEKLRAAVKKQITDYRANYEDLILRGDYYSILNPYVDKCSAYYYTDGESFLLSFLQCGAEAESRDFILTIPEADETAVYLDTVSGKNFSGKELINGIVINTKNSSGFSCLWHFVAEKQKNFLSSSC